MEREILSGLYSYGGKLERQKHIVYYVYSYSLKLHTNSQTDIRVMVLMVR